MQREERFGVYRNLPVISLEISSFESLIFSFIGTFSDNGERSNIQDCVSACCNTPLCDVALIQGKRCFSVQCSNNKTACQEVRADSLSTTSTVAYIARYKDSGHVQGMLVKNCFFMKTVRSIQYTYSK